MLWESGIIDDLRFTIDDLKTRELGAETFHYFYELTVTIEKS